jgi:hypothetical protein
MNTFDNLARQPTLPTLVSIDRMRGVGWVRGGIYSCGCFTIFALIVRFFFVDTSFDVFPCVMCYDLQKFSQPNFRGSFTSKTPKFVMICDWRAKMNVKPEPNDWRSSEMARMTLLRECNGIQELNSLKLPSERNGPTKTAYFGGTFTSEKSENFTKNQHSSNLKSSHHSIGFDQ